MQLLSFCVCVVLHGNTAPNNDKTSDIYVATPMIVYQQLRPIRMQLLSFLCMCCVCMDEVAECCRMLPNAAEIDNMMTKKPHTNQADFAVGGNGW